MLAKSPDDRPRDASTLTKELRKIKVSEDENWDTLIEKLVASELQDTRPSDDLPESKLAATRQLQAVMKGNLTPWWREPKTWAATITLSVVAVAMGAVLAKSNPPIDPLEANETITQLGTLEEQYLEALWKDLAGNDDRVEALWTAVIEFESDKSDETGEHYRREAKARLAEWYVAQKRYEPALKLYDDLANTADLGVRFNAIGMAGRAIVFDLQSLDSAKIRAVLTKLQKMKSRDADVFKNEYYETRVTRLIEKYLATETVGSPSH